MFSLILSVVQWGTVQTPNILWLPPYSDHHTGAPATQHDSIQTGALPHHTLGFHRMGHIQGPMHWDSIQGPCPPPLPYSAITLITSSYLCNIIKHDNQYIDKQNTIFHTRFLILAHSLSMVSQLCVIFVGFHSILTFTDIFARCST